MVLQILANAGQVLDDVDSEAAKGLRLPDAGEHQWLWAIDDPGSKDHFIMGSDIRYSTVCHSCTVAMNILQSSPTPVVDDSVQNKIQKLFS